SRGIRDCKLANPPRIPQRRSRPNFACRAHSRPGPQLTVPQAQDSDFDPSPFCILFKAPGSQPAISAHEGPSGHRYESQVFQIEVGNRVLGKKFGHAHSTHHSKSNIVRWNQVRIRTLHCPKTRRLEVLIEVAYHASSVSRPVSVSNNLDPFRAD